MRILITGSRTWSDEEVIRRAIETAVDDAFEADSDMAIENVVIVHGACPRGADEIADHHARREDYRVERHPADWDAHGKRAGLIRNSEMAKAGADVCLAFCKDNSRGTEHMIAAARRAGIRVREYCA